MLKAKPIVKGSVLLGLIVVASACVVEPREGYRDEPREGYRDGYYDSDHHRYYHEHRWHECVERDEHCR
jgi:hypothetical protein